MAKKTMNNTIIAPLATAIWLIDNTSLTFKQIGDFCGFTETEIKFIADGIIGKKILPANPINNGNLTREEISKRERDGKPLHNAFTLLNGINIKIQKKKKYIPMLQRRSRPNAVLWLVNYYPDLSDSQIIKLVRTTKKMVQAIRDKSYRNYNELTAKDPIVLGFCSQTDIETAVSIVSKSVNNDQQDQQQDNNNKEENKQKKKIKKINVNKVKIKKNEGNSEKIEQIKKNNASIKNKKNVKGNKAEKNNAKKKIIRNSKKEVNFKKNIVDRDKKKDKSSNIKITKNNSSKETKISVKKENKKKTNKNVKGQKK